VPIGRVSLNVDDQLSAHYVEGQGGPSDQPLSGEHDLAAPVGEPPISARRWYPTARIFRQRCVGEWPALFDEVATALRNSQLSSESSVVAALSLLHLPCRLFHGTISALPGWSARLR
jgi:hypothetical protein